MKKIVSLILSVCLMFAAVGVMPAAAEATSFNDMNDVLLLLKLVVSCENFNDEQIAIYDLNCDGRVGAADALIAMKEVLSVSEPQLFMMGDRDNMLDGDSIDFQVGGNFNANYEHYKGVPFNAAIMNSPKEFEKLFNTVRVSLGFEEYPDSFFNENALIALFIDYSSISTTHTIDAVSIDNGEICVATTTEYPETVLTKLSCAMTFIEVKKTDVAGVKQITRFDQATIFIPSLKTPETLSTEMGNQIKEEWVSGYTNPGPQHIIDSVNIINYYGAYNGLTALRIKDNYYSGPLMVIDLNVDGVVFYGYKNPEIYLWENGSFVRFYDAYEQGLITRNDLKNIAYYYNSEK
jgi:hypothetical protein